MDKDKIREDYDRFVTEDPSGESWDEKIKQMIRIGCDIGVVHITARKKTENVDGLPDGLKPLVFEVRITPHSDDPTRILTACSRRNRLSLALHGAIIGAMNLWKP